MENITLTSLFQAISTLETLEHKAVMAVKETQFKYHSPEWYELTHERLEITKVLEGLRSLISDLPDELSELYSLQNEVNEMEGEIADLRIKLRDLAKKK